MLTDKDRAEFDAILLTEDLDGITPFIDRILKREFKKAWDNQERLAFVLLLQGTGDKEPIEIKGILGNPKLADKLSNKIPNE